MPFFKLVKWPEINFDVLCIGEIKENGGKYITSWTFPIGSRLVPLSCHLALGISSIVRVRNHETQSKQASKHAEQIDALQCPSLTNHSLTDTLDPFHDPAK